DTEYSAHSRPARARCARLTNGDANISVATGTGSSEIAGHSVKGFSDEAQTCRRLSPRKALFLQTRAWRSYQRREDIDWGTNKAINKYVQNRRAYDMTAFVCRYEIGFQIRS